jgi:hypothetical protein
MSWSSSFHVAIWLLVICTSFLFRLALQAHSRSYEMERQDMSPELGNYTMEQFFDMMNILSESNNLFPDGNKFTLQQFSKLPGVRLNSTTKLMRNLF